MYGSALRYSVRMQSGSRKEDARSRGTLPRLRPIVHRVQEGEADLIRVKGQVRSGLSRALYGSAAAGVLHSVDRSLLIVWSRTDG